MHSRALIVGTASALFATACVLPAFQGTIMGEDADLIGLQLLLLPCLFSPVWLANVALARALWCLWGRHFRSATLAAVTALALAGLPLAAIWYRSSFPGQLRVGYYFWLASMVIGLAGAVIWARTDAAVGEECRRTEAQ